VPLLHDVEIHALSLQQLGFHCPQLIVPSFTNTGPPGKAKRLIYFLFTTLNYHRAFFTGSMLMQVLSNAASYVSHRIGISSNGSCFFASAACLLACLIYFLSGKDVDVRWKV